MTETGETTLPRTATELRIDRGVCHVLFAFDAGFAIDVDEAERRTREVKQREFIRRTRKAPRYFQYRPPPLRVTIPAEPIALAGYATEAMLDLVIYDFGVISAIYRIPMAGPLGKAHELGLALYDNESLLADSRRRVERLVHALGPAISKPHPADMVEDYVIFQITASTPRLDADRLVGEHALAVAQLLRAEAEVLSPQEVEDAISCRIAFGPFDLTVIDWNAAMLVGADMDDVLAVLEFANVELLEMRFLDDKLDAALTEAYTLFAQRHWSRRWRLRPRAAVLERIARLQLDSAILFEGVNNTLKLLGDPYLARVYRLAAQRLHLAEWDASILRKLKTVESIYERISDQQSALRMEILEWIIILLIAISIVVSLK